MQASEPIASPRTATQTSAPKPHETQPRSLDSNTIFACQTLPMPDLFWTGTAETVADSPDRTIRSLTVTVFSDSAIQGRAAGSSARTGPSLLRSERCAGISPVSRRAHELAPVFSTGRTCGMAHALIAVFHDLDQRKPA